MSIIFRCSSCNKKITAPERLAGKQGKCPGCGNMVTVPVPVVPTVEEPKGPACPYCGEGLPRMPKRKMKCHSCEKDIFVRSKQKILPGSLFTQEDARVLDWLKRLEYLGIIDRFIKQKEKVGQSVKARDILWHVLNELALKAEDGTAHYQMALFSREEGKPFFALLQESARMNLLKYKRGGVKKVRIATAGEYSCAACQSFEGKVLSIRKALKTMPIPNKDCTFRTSDDERSFCRCRYIPEYEPSERAGLTLRIVGPEE